MEEAAYPTSNDNALICDGCGARLVYVPSLQALKCEFCGKIRQSVGRNEAVASPDAAAAFDAIVPMTVSKKELEIATLEYMARGKYTRDDIIETAHITRIEQMYCPFFIDSGYHDASEVFLSGGISGDYYIIGYGGARLPQNVSRFMEESNWREKWTPWLSDYVVGIDVESPQKDAADSFQGWTPERIGKIVMEHAKKYRSDTPQRKLNRRSESTPDIDDIETILIPVCRISIMFNDIEYILWVDGADLTRFLEEALPEDSARKGAISLNMMLPILTFAVFFMSWLIIKGSPNAPEALWKSFSVFGAAWFYSNQRSTDISRYSENLRASLLEFKKASLADTSALSEDEQRIIFEGFRRPKRPWLASNSSLLFVLPLLLAVSAQIFFAKDYLGIGREAEQPYKDASSTDVCAAALGRDLSTWGTGANFSTPSQRQDAGTSPRHPAKHC